MGSPWFNADILIDDEKISKISRDRAKAKLTIDASLLVEFKLASFKNIKYNLR